MKAVFILSAVLLSIVAIAANDTKDALVYRPDPFNDKSRCRLPRYSGPCLAYIPRWFYNSETGKCEEFVYGGCRGNANNFRTLNECLKACQQKNDVIPPEEVDCSLVDVYCKTHPCATATCSAYPKAECRASMCGCGDAVFYVGEMKVDCDKKPPQPFTPPIRKYPLPWPYPKIPTPIENCREVGKSCSVTPKRTLVHGGSYPWKGGVQKSQCCPWLECCVCNSPIATAARYVVQPKGTCMPQCICPLG